MSDSVWMRDQGGAFAYVPAAEVDTWKPRGLQESAEPSSNTDFVWMRHGEVTGTPKIPWGARDYWLAKGFAPSPPEEPRDLTKDPALDDVRGDEPDAKPAKKTTAKAAKPEAQE